MGVVREIYKEAVYKAFRLYPALKLVSGIERIKALERVAETANNSEEQKWLWEAAVAHFERLHTEALDSAHKKFPYSEVNEEGFVLNRPPFIELGPTDTGIPAHRLTLALAKARLAALNPKPLIEKAAIALLLFYRVWGNYTTQTKLAEQYAHEFSLDANGINGLRRALSRVKTHLQGEVSDPPVDMEKAYEQAIAYSSAVQDPPEVVARLSSKVRPPLK